MGFFNDIHGMLSSGFEGRYLAHIITMISRYDKRILQPLIDYPLANKFNPNSITCDTEYRYIEDCPVDTIDRSADLVIKIPGVLEVLIEIKAEDGGSKNSSKKLIAEPNNPTHNEGQLRDYIKWLRTEKNDGVERRLVLLNKYHSVHRIKEILKNEVDEKTYRKIKNLTFSTYAEKLEALFSNDEQDSSFLNLLFEYFSDEGLVMFKLNEDDRAAFVSFMVLNFLPHQSGHGKQAVREKITKGPEIFSKLIQNWQLASEHFSNQYLQTRIPTVRYWPHQEYDKLAQNLEEVNQVTKRNMIRKSKVAGTWTIYSDSVIDENNNRLEFGIEYRIKIGEKKFNSETTYSPIQIAIYCAFRQRTETRHEYIKILKNGFDEKCFTDSFSLVSTIKDLISKVAEELDQKIDRSELKFKEIIISLRNKLNSND